MTIKIYGTKLTTSTARVLATLYEKEVDDFELIKVDIVNGEQKNQEFMKMNPWGKIPVMVDGDLVLYESRAIAREIATKYEGQGTPLLGSTRKEKALVNQWIEVEGHTFDGPIGAVMWQLLFGPNFYGEQTNKAVLSENLAKLEGILDVYAAHLSTSKYLAGDFFSLADLFHLPYLYYLAERAGRADLLDSRPAVKAWWERISTRPSWKKWQAFFNE